MTAPTQKLFVRKLLVLLAADREKEAQALVQSLSDDDREILMARARSRVAEREVLG